MIKLMTVISPIDAKPAKKTVVNNPMLRLLPDVIAI